MCGYFRGMKFCSIKISWMTEIQDFYFRGSHICFTSILKLREFNFMDGKLPARTAKFMSHENFHVYSIQLTSTIG